VASRQAEARGRKTIGAIGAVAAIASGGSVPTLDASTGLEIQGDSSPVARYQWVRMRTRVQNALHAIREAHGVRRGQRVESRGSAPARVVAVEPNTAIVE